MNFYVGPHMSLIDFNYNLENIITSVINMGGNCCQIYTSNTDTLSIKSKTLKLDNVQIENIKKMLKKNNFKLFIHLHLSLNLSNATKSPNKNLGIKNILYDLEIGEKLGVSGYVIHLGYKKTTKYNISEEEAINNYVNNMKYIIDNFRGNYRILIETDVNLENRIDGTIVGLGDIYDRFDNKYRKNIGICVDTAHIFAAGYDLRKINEVKKYFKNFDKFIGLKNLDLIHLNDSNVKFNSRLDRHTSLGKGYIFDKSKGGNINTLPVIVNIAKKNNVPLILETRDFIYYKTEIKLVKDCIQKGGVKKNFKPKIIECLTELKELHIILDNKREAKAYSDVVQTLNHLNVNIYSSNNAKNIPTIGKGTLNKIDEIIKNGKLQIITDIKKNKDIKTLLKLTSVVGIGPILARKLLNNNINTIKKLKVIADKYEKTEKKEIIKFSKLQLMGIKYYDDLLHKIPREEITKIKNYMNKFLKKDFRNIELTIAGSYRTGKKFSKDIDLIITFNNLKTNNNINKSNYFEYLIKIMEENKILIEYVNVNKYHAFGILKTKYSKYHRHIDIRLIPINIYPFYLLYFGSGEMFSRRIRHYASQLGFKLSDTSLINLITGDKLKVKDEKDIFKFLNIEYIKPEDRTNPIILDSLFNK